MTVTPCHADAHVTVWAGDCLDILALIPTGTVDAVITDPPYGLAFMGKAWDSHITPAAYQTWCTAWATECLRVTKPGGHIAAFGGTRTAHRLGCAIEDAGYEVRDSIAWLYSQGFPKSLDVSKAIDKAAGAEREVGVLSGRSGSGRTAMDSGTRSGDLAGDYFTTAPATADAIKWDGWGTALKPAHEPILIGRKPLAAATVAGNVLAYGTGAINIDASRIGLGDETLARSNKVGDNGWANHSGGPNAAEIRKAKGLPALGRWPANVVLDESQAAVLDAMSGELHSQDPRTRKGTKAESMAFGERTPGDNYGDSGGASRFFYIAKAPKKERPIVNGIAHPTVKPLALMRYLITLLTPPGGLVLDPFLGSGTTVEAAIITGHKAVGIERETDYLPMVTARINRQQAIADGRAPTLFDDEATQ